MIKEGVFEEGDTITIDDGVILKAVWADTDGSGCYVCDNGKEKCYFLNKDMSKLSCPKCHSSSYGLYDYCGPRVIFINEKQGQKKSSLNMKIDDAISILQAIQEGKTIEYLVTEPLYEEHWETLKTDDIHCILRTLGTSDKWRIKS